MIEDHRIISLEIRWERESFVLRTLTLSEDQVHPQKKKKYIYTVTVYDDKRLRHSFTLFENVVQRATSNINNFVYFYIESILILNIKIRIKFIY